MITFDSGATLLSTEDQEAIDFIKGRSPAPAAAPANPSPSEPAPAEINA
jgi:hypothetical protein